MKTLIIDGNNLIHKADNLKKIFLKDKTESQRTLIEFLRGKLSEFKNVIIVFDGYGNFKDKNVFFSENKTADEVIKSKIGSIENTKLLTIVSSDNEIINFSRKCSCEIIKSEDFLKLKSGTVSIGKDKNINENFDYDEFGEKPKKPSKKDLEFYKNVFS